MALNYSYWPVFPAHVSEDNLVSPMRIADGYFVDDVPNMNGEGYLRPWFMIPEEAEERNFNYWWDGGDPSSSQQSTSDDIVHRLPSDPFGMDIQTTVTALTGWLVDLERDYGGYIGTNNCRATQESHSLCGGWNMFCNNSFMFHPFLNSIQGSEILNLGSFPSSFQTSETQRACQSSVPGNVNLDETLQAASTSEERSMGDAVTFSNGRDSCYSEPGSSEEVRSVPGPEVMRHEALAYLFRNLGLKDVLSLEMASKSILTTFRQDPLSWSTIHIDRPLNERITDDDLSQLVSRAHGNLQCLSLVECPKISEECLRRILETNPELTKLSVPGCTRISIECILNIIRAHNSKNSRTGGIKSLRIGGLYGVNKEHFEELKLLLGVNEKKLESDSKPLFHHRGNFYLPHDDDRAIDIEMCPRCEKFRLVYDCPAEGCKVKDKSPQVCRACTFCIARCAQCGRCINDTEFEETFCLELLCSGCFKEPRQAGQEG